MRPAPVVEQRLDRFGPKAHASMRVREVPLVSRFLGLCSHLLLSAVMIAAVAIGSSKAASDLSSQKEALDVLADFADRLCQAIPLEGSSESLELSGSAKAELSEIIKKLADLGIEGAAKFKETQYEGLLQKDLASMLQASTQCKLEVFRELKSELLAGASGAAPEASFVGKAYAVTYNDPVQRNVFTAIMAFLDEPTVRWRYDTPGAAWNWLSRTSTTGRIVELSGNRVRSDGTREDEAYSIEFTPDYNTFSGRMRFVFTAPDGSASVRNYDLSGTIKR